MLLLGVILLSPLLCLAARQARCGMQAAAVIDRIRRAIATVSDRVSARIDPIASAFGKAFGVDDWCNPDPCCPACVEPGNGACAALSIAGSFVMLSVLPLLMQAFALALTRSSASLTKLLDNVLPPAP